MKDKSRRAEKYIAAIRASALSIYDEIEVGHPTLWIPTITLELLLRKGLVGVSLKGLPLRTRSRLVKELVCKALGYPVPQSFKRTRPRFPGQLFDTYVQKSNNLQIWNDELSATRRYALFHVSHDDMITDVKVVTGETLARLDTTGTLTQKYQARLICAAADRELVTPTDTEVVVPLTGQSLRVHPGASPIDWPRPGDLLPIAVIFRLLCDLIGERFPDCGQDQERNRGAALHELICQRLGYAQFRDVGQFPDVRHQLLEVKLQTSPTIDLGLICPDSKDSVGLPKIVGHQIRHCDVRYALFYATTDGETVHLSKLFVTTGARFLARFPKFQGRVVNRKLQIPLPSGFFSC